VIRLRSIVASSLFVALAALATGSAVSAPVASETPPEILVSRQLLEAHGLRVGQLVRFSVSADGDGARPFRIAGSYEPLANPFILAEKRWEARFHLPDLIALRNPDGDPLLAETVTRLNIALGDPGAAAAFGDELTARLPGLSVRPTAAPQGGPDPFVVLERFHLAIAVVTVVGSSAFLLALMVMRSEERRETAGILRLIGLSRPRILREGFAEGLLVALFGSVFGVLLALVLQTPFNRFFQWHYDTSLVFLRVTPGIIVRCIAIAVPLGVTAGLVASWTLLRRNILSLLRR
jgi:hypothetical protein